MDFKHDLTEAVVNPLRVLIVLSLVTGIVYPFAVTGIAQAVFPHQANGSLIREKSSVVGSELIGQEFKSARYLHSRPSATSPYPYNAASSSGSNLGPTNPALVKQVQDRCSELVKSNDGIDIVKIPADLVMASGSGLDPHISIEAATYQSARIARARGIPLEKVSEIIEKFTEDRQFGVLGEPRVNVLRVNLALDGKLP